MFREVYDFPNRGSCNIVKDTGTMEILMGGDGPITKLWELYGKTMEYLKQEDPSPLPERIHGLQKSLRSQTEENQLFTSKSKSFWAIDRLSLSWNKHKKEIHFCLSRTVRKKTTEKNQLFRMELMIDAPYHDQLEPTTEQPEETEETKYDSGSVIIKEETTTPPVTLTGLSRGAEAHSTGDGSALSDRYSKYTAGSGEVPSENGSIEGPSLKRQLTDLARGADEKRLRRESTPSVDSDSNRPDTKASNLDSVASTASIGNF